MVAPFQQVIPVVVVAGTRIQARYQRMPIYVDFGRGLHFELWEGRNDLALPPGRFRAQLYSGGWMRVGRAFLDIDTTRGPVNFFYAPPYTIWSQGAAGFHPVERPGRGALAVIIALVVVTLVLWAAALILR
ncbi:hypothetical protein OHB12_07055 [Nocardia sp. NBC_01730]|uniref:hypothetical protein n=1 Tax=Nocardia sp. NBC_01730 TaxID=2975998 RepID=UPI002E0E1C97|nr:hypothetical protein OHB12_07055 [Nocardia sp. NBC_01730]